MVLLYYCGVIALSVVLIPLLDCNSVHGADSFNPTGTPWCCCCSVHGIDSFSYTGTLSMVLYYSTTALTTLISTSPPTVQVADALIDFLSGMNFDIIASLVMISTMVLQLKHVRD